VGENFKITLRGWEKFADDLKRTGVTHLYAGSESTVHGELKVKMRDAVRDNRTKHQLHIDPTNINVIDQIGQMWWNPRNSKVIQDFKREERGGAPVNEFQVGERVVLKTEDTLVPHQFTWHFGSVLDVGEGANRLVEFTDGEKSWFNLMDPRLSCSSRNELVFVEAAGGKTWPAILFTESRVFVRLTMTPERTLQFAVDVDDHKVSPFFVDEESQAGNSQTWKDTVQLASQYYYRS